MYLHDVLDGLSNSTDEVNDFVMMDPENKLVVYMEPGIELNSSVGLQPVPDGFNIFKLLNISDPDDVEGWSIALKNESIRYEKIEGIFDVSELFFVSTCSSQRIYNKKNHSHENCVI